MVLNVEGNFTPKYRMFVDDLISAILCHLKNTHHFIAPNIESVYVLIGYPGAITEPDLPPTMPKDKLKDQHMGLEFLNCNL